MSIKYIEARLLDGDDLEDIGEVVEEGEWINDGKYDLQTSVIYIDNNEGGKQEGYYAINYNRTGSYYSDYEYSEPYITKVKPKIVQKTQWVPV